METIRKSIGRGFGKGPLYYALAYDPNDKYSGYAIKQLGFNPDTGKTAITIGDSTTAITLATYAQRAISIYTTCASADGSNMVLPVYINATMSGTGGIGRALEAKLTVSGKLGYAGNAIKGYTDVTLTSVATTGLISAVCAELKLPSATLAGGVYAVLELNWVGQANTDTMGALTGAHTTLIYANVGGGDATDFDARGYILEIEGMSDSDGNAWYDNTLRIAIGDTAWYLPMSTAQGSFTTAYPIVSTYAGEALSITSTLSGDTAINGVEMAFTAATTSSAMVSHGSSEGLYIYQNITGVKSGSSRTEALSVVQTVTGSGASNYAYVAHFHWHNAGNPATPNVTGLQIDMDNPGNAVSNMIGLDVYRDGANTGSCRDTFVRCANGGSGLPEAAFYLEGPQGTGVAEKLFIFSYCEGGSSFLVDGDVTGSPGASKKIKVNVCDSPGTTGTDYYIALWAAS